MFDKFVKRELHKHSVNSKYTCMQLADAEINSTYVKAQTLICSSFTFWWERGKKHSFEHLGFMNCTIQKL